jgi:hypothetical protein
MTERHEEIRRLVGQGPLNPDRPGPSPSEKLFDAFDAAMRAVERVCYGEAENPGGSLMKIEIDLAAAHAEIKTDLAAIKRELNGEEPGFFAQIGHALGFRSHRQR